MKTMKHLLPTGFQKIYSFVVAQEHMAQFQQGIVHKVCSTFALAQAMEWASRLILLDMIDDDEDGVGNYLEIEHHSPAFSSEKVQVTAEILALKANKLECLVNVQAGDRCIARGKTVQTILKKSKIRSIFDPVQRRDKK